MSEGAADPLAVGVSSDRWARDPTGVPGLDAVLGGGLARGALVLVLGLPGSGKTTLAAQLAFAAGQAGRAALSLSAVCEWSSCSHQWCGTYSGTSTVTIAFGRLRCTRSM